MIEGKKIVFLACQKCMGINSKILPELMLTFGETLHMLPISCAGSLKPLSLVAILRQGWDGLIVLCPKDACCCPGKVKSVMRRETLKGILPVFGISKERLEIITATPFVVENVKSIVEKMIDYIEFDAQESVWSHIEDSIREYKSSCFH